MKLVREHINEKFEEESDPISDMGIGIKEQIRRDLDKIGIPMSDVIISEKGEIYTRYGKHFRKPEKLKEIQLKYLSDEKRKKFAQRLIDTYGTNSIIVLEKITKEALKDNISQDDIKKLVNEYGHEYDKKRIHMVLSKLTRTPEEKKNDEENNIYVFIGYTEKHLVIINGKKYYEDRFQAEKMIKIDKYKYSDLAMISMMNIRAKTQYGHDGNVYMINVPKDLMNEESYHKIPEEYRTIIEEHKKRIQ